MSVITVMNNDMSVMEAILTAKENLLIALRSLLMRLKVASLWWKLINTVSCD
jgi:hypothetical protein